MSAGSRPEGQGDENEDQNADEGEEGCKSGRGIHEAGNPVQDCGGSLPTGGIGDGRQLRNDDHGHGVEDHDDQGEEKGRIGHGSDDGANDFPFCREKIRSQQKTFRQLAADLAGVDEQYLFRSGQTGQRFAHVFACGEPVTHEGVALRGERVGGTRLFGEEPQAFVNGHTVTLMRGELAPAAFPCL